MREDLASRADPHLNSLVTGFINLVALGREVPSALEEEIRSYGNSGHIIFGATLEGFHRQRDLRPRNGSLGKERG